MPKGRLSVPGETVADGVDKHWLIQQLASPLYTRVPSGCYRRLAVEEC